MDYAWSVRDAGHFRVAWSDVMKAEIPMRAFIAACLVATLSVACTRGTTYSSSVPTRAPSTATSTAHQSLPAGIATDFATLVTDNGPAVVNISTSRERHGPIFQ